MSLKGKKDLHRVTSPEKTVVSAAGDRLVGTLDQKKAPYGLCSCENASRWPCGPACLDLDSTDSPKS